MNKPINDTSKPDSELRAAIDKIMGQAAYYGDALNLDRSKGNAIRLYNEVRTDIEALVRPLLTAERTAIKAALPEKRKYTQYGSLGFSVDADNRTKGYNQALTDVTQVIDGREGV